jgi:hypothetical protein
MSDDRRRHPLSVRLGVGAALAALALSAAGAVGAPSAGAADPCSTEVLRTLTNGTGDGSLSVAVRGAGDFAGAVFDPPGPLGPATTTNTSSLYVGGPVGRFLVGECVFVDSEVGGQSLTTHFDLAGLSVALTQSLAPIADRTSALTQTYSFTNVGDAPVSLALVRHVDGDLLFDGNKVDGAAASPDGSQLSEFDAGDTAPRETLLGISGSLGTTTPDRWTIQPAQYTQAIEGANGIPAADDGVVASTPVDATLSQQWSVTGLAVGSTATFTTVTHFGTPPNRHTLSVGKTGDGTVTSAPAGIACGPTCSATYDEGTVVALAAIPDPGWSFAGWEGACSGPGFCAVPMNGPRSLVAHFSPPPPTPGQTVNVVPVSGRVLVREPGSGRFVELTATDQLPVGSQVDTTGGTIQLTAARAGGATDTTNFFDGIFTILQDAPTALTELRLEGGDFSCLEPSAFGLQATKKPIRRLWGSGKGKFRTRGKYSSATVRGTRWKTEDRCDGTLTLVEEGVVAVRDFVRNADVTLRVGQSYLAAPLSRGVSSAGCTLIGTPSKDILRGTPKRDVICGLGGADVLFGMGGNDKLYGGDGNDWLDGGFGNDLLNGGAGHDRLDGGRGRDFLAGGKDRDLLITRDGRRGNDRVIAGSGKDLCRTDAVRVCP